MAHEKLGRRSILAEVITCSRKEAYLQSLVENIARTQARQHGFRTRTQASSRRRLGLSSGSPGLPARRRRYIKDYITLVEKGEERLIRGVEQGVFPMGFAVQVSTSDDAQIQNVLMDAFDEGIVTTNNFAQARRIIIGTFAKDTKRRNSPKTYTVTQLRQDISKVTKAKVSYVREAKTKENRFMSLLEEINMLWRGCRVPGNSQGRGARTSGPSCRAIFVTNPVQPQEETFR